MKGYKNVFEPSMEQVMSEFELKGSWNKSFFKNENPIITKTQDQVILHKEVEDWLPKVNREEDL